jgi:hypothetical protein
MMMSTFYESLCGILSLRIVYEQKRNLFFVRYLSLELAYKRDAKFI